MNNGRTRRMHTVAKGYFEAWAVKDPARRTPGIWRFDRITGDAKMLGIADAEVAKDIYTIFGDDGSPDTWIEDEILCGLEGAFCTAFSTMPSGKDDIKARGLSKEQWSGLARFIAAQLLRTPGFFQSMRDWMDAEGITYERDVPQRVMVLLIERWIPRLLRMRGILAYNETGIPLLTSDNPAVTWKKSGHGFICGVDQFDPELIVSCPLSPTLIFVAYQTAESLNAVHAERYDIPRKERPRQYFTSHVDVGALPEAEVRRMNHLCVSNAHRYVYASYSDKSLLRFLRNRFFGAAAPVRRRDLQPIGNPIRKVADPTN